jgi:hypothetical protein
MSRELEARAEIAKLAALLSRAPGSLDYLQGAEPTDLRRLREQATDRLYDADRAAMQRIAATSKLVPVPLVAKLGEGVFGALLCARVAGLLDPPRAVEIATRLSPAFLADVAMSLDPRRVSDVIAQMPVERIVAVARELLARSELITMGRFVGHLSDPALLASARLADGPALLRIAFVLEGKERLDHLVSVLSDDQLAAMLAAADAERLWPEVLDLLGHLDEGNLHRLADITAARDEELLARLSAAAAREGIALRPRARTPAPAQSDPSRRWVKERTPGGRP